MVASSYSRERVFVDRFPDSLKMKTISAEYHGNKGYHAPDSLMVLRGKDDKASTLIYPDSLLNILVKNNVCMCLRQISAELAVKMARPLIRSNGSFLSLRTNTLAVLSRVMQIGSRTMSPHRY
jgi:hypothetical protein